MQIPDTTTSVLYLAPPREDAGSLTAFTFVDEEILALAEAGVRVFVPTYPVAEAEPEPPHPNIMLCPWPSGRQRGERGRTLAFVREIRRLVPSALWRAPRLLYHAARLERCAAEFIRKYDIDLIHSQFGWPEGFGGVLAAYTSGRPLVATMRGMDVIADRDIDAAVRLRRDIAVVEVDR